MTAAYIDALGPPESIRVGDLALPAPGPTDVLVRVDLVAADPVDALVRSGRYPTRLAFPFVVGRDLVGTVAWAPPGGALRLGDQVWCNSLGHQGRQGSFAQYAVVPAERCYRLPPGVESAAVVAAAHPAATAYLGLFEHAQLRPGEVVYVGGAGGNVGSAAAAMAQHAGARVVASAAPADIGRCRSSGIESVLDYHEPDLGGRIAEAAPSGVDVFWDTSGHHDFDLVARVVAPGGRVVLSAAANSAPAMPAAAIYTRDISLHGFVMSRAPTTQLERASKLICDMLQRSQLRPQITEVLPLSSTPEVHRRLEAGAVRGRILLRPG